MTPSPTPVASESIADFALESRARSVKLFRNGANQALRIPKEFELPGNEALIHREGDRLIIEPIRKLPEKGTLAALALALEELAALGLIDEEFPDVDEGLLPLDDITFDEPAP